MKSYEKQAARPCHSFRQLNRRNLYRSRQVLISFGRCFFEALQAQEALRALSGTMKKIQKENMIVRL
jgi:hypothetical protein